MSKKGDTTKMLIRRTAQSLFVQKGFKEVTMKDICDETGLSRGGLYRHYDSTNQIFSDIVNEIMSSLEDEFAAKIEKGMPAIRILDEFLERYQSEMLDRKNSLGLAIYEYYSGLPMSKDNPLLKQYNHSQSMLGNLIQYGINTGEFNNIKISAVINLLLFSYQGVRLLGDMMPIEKSVPEEIIGEIRNMIIKKVNEEQSK